MYSEVYPGPQTTIVAKLSILIFLGYSGYCSDIGNQLDAQPKVNLQPMFT